MLMLQKQTPCRRYKHHNNKKSLEEVFKKLNRDYVKIKKRDRLCNNEILDGVLRELLKIMQNQNKLFKKMKPEIEYLGSYYDGLRVGQPTEYDINLIMKLPVNYNKIYLDASESHNYDCTHIYMASEFRRLSKLPAMAEEGFKETNVWCDSKHRLSVKKFRSWMQKVVDTAVNNLPAVNGERMICVNDKYYQISTKMSGPASTVTIMTGSRDNNVIDVDLVPTFAFSLPKKPYKSKISFELVESAHARREYFAVPKPSDDEYSWRLAFPFQERILIKGKNNLKSTVKLLKLLRDAQDFKPLASYYIKTVFLWEVIEQEDDFWKQNSLSFLVLHMLKKLRQSLSIKEIKNFWCPEANLIQGKINVDACQHFCNRLSVIIKTIEESGKNNHDKVIEYFSLSKPKSN